MTMSVVEIKVVGIGSILMHNPAGMRSQTGGMQRGGKRIPEPMDEAVAALYSLPDGQLYIKSDAFREAAIIAASDVRDTTRKGRATMGRRFAASVFSSKETFPLTRPKNGKPITSNPKDWELDIRRAVVQKNGVLRARPKITDWSCIVEFEYDDEIIDPSMIVDIVAMSGKYPGVLDYRVGKKGAFGRYTAELVNSK